MSLEIDNINVSGLTANTVSVNNFFINGGSVSGITHSQINLNDGTNPHGTTKSDVGLGNVDNTSDSTKNSATATLINKTINLTNNTLNDNSISLGDLVKSNGSKFVRFPVGSSYSLLRTNSSGTDLEWTSGPLVYSVLGSTTDTTTISNTYELMADMQFNNVVGGNYLLSFGGWIDNTGGNAETFMEIYINGNPVSNSEMKHRRGSNNNSRFQGTFNYSNFPISSIPNNATIEIRWRRSAGTSSITNRYLTLIKI